MSVAFAKNLKSRLIKFLLISSKCSRCVIIDEILWHAFLTTEAVAFSNDPILQ